MEILEAVGKYFTVKKLSRTFFTTIEHDSLIIDLDNGIFFWNANINPANGKPYSGDGNAFLRLMGEAIDYDENSFTISTFLHRIAKASEEQVTEYIKGGYTGQCDYLRKRGISEKTITRFDIEHTDDRILFPFATGNYLTRLIPPADNTIRYIKPRNLISPVWPMYGFYEYNAKAHIVLFEGVFSVLRFVQSDQGNARQYHSAMGTKFYSAVRQFSSYVNVTVVVDCDEAGTQAMDNLKQYSKWVNVIQPTTMPDQMLTKEIKEFIKTNL